MILAFGYWLSFSDVIGERLRSNIYAGGVFSWVYNGSWSSASGIAVWNGSTWSALGGGVDGHVHAIESNGTDVYACGVFTTAGGSAAANVAVWNGSTWSAMGAGLNATCNTLRTFGGHLYAGGLFMQAGGSTANRVALWDGTSWSPLMNGASNGVNSYVYTISGTTNLVVAGYFTTAGSIPARRVAIWTPLSIGPETIPDPGPDPVPVH